MAVEEGRLDVQEEGRIKKEAWPEGSRRCPAG